ncbi:archease [Halobacteria archaeon AArc-dxtr1]|nr:archease [Halobacteria archaeon AArc-dxtr1]
MGFELRDHTADVGVAATGADIESVFAAVADGLVAASCEDVPADVGDRFSVSVTAENREALLFDYLDELIYQRDVREVMPVDNRVKTIEQDSDETPPHHTDETAEREVDASLSIEASARAIPLDRIDAREVKAVTYSEMRLEPVADGWEAYVVFDV